MNDRTMNATTSAPAAEMLTHHELGRVHFVSKNLLRLQGLYLVAFGLPFLVQNTTAHVLFHMPALCQRRHEYALLLSVPLGLGLIAWVYRHYRRSIGCVHYSLAQGRAVHVPLVFWAAATFGALFLFTVDAALFAFEMPRPPVASILLLNLAFGLALLAQWWAEGRSRKLVHYPLIGGVNVGVSALAALGYHLDTTSTAYFVGRPQPFFDYVTLSVSIIVLGLCDHFVLTRHLKKVPVEPPGETTSRRVSRA